MKPPSRIAMASALLLLLSGTALAKVVVQGAFITGPKLKADTELGPRASTKLADLVGFYPSVFEQVPDPTLEGRPANLGPRYRVSYQMFGDGRGKGTVRQDLYPYAAGGPVSHIAGGQRLSENMGKTTGGWFQASEYALEGLTELGIPKRKALPEPATGSDPGTDSKRPQPPPANAEPEPIPDAPSAWPWLLLGAGALFAAGLLWRQRTRSARAA